MDYVVSSCIAMDIGVMSYQSHPITYIYREYIYSYRDQLVERTSTILHESLLMGRDMGHGCGLLIAMQAVSVENTNTVTA